MSLFLFLTFLLYCLFFTIIIVYCKSYGEEEQTTTALILLNVHWHLNKHTSRQSIHSLTLRRHESI